MLLVCLLHESHRMLDEGPVWCVSSTCPAQCSVRGSVCLYLVCFLHVSCSMLGEGPVAYTVYLFHVSLRPNTHVSAVVQSLA